MKRFALLLYSSPLLAQTPVDTGSTFGFNPVVITIIVVAAIAVGIFIWHRKNPVQSDTALKSVTDLFHKQADIHAATVAKLPDPPAQVPPWERKP